MIPAHRESLSTVSDESEKNNVSGTDLSFFSSGANVN